MKEIDRLLEIVQRDVELHGTSGASTVFLTNVQFNVPRESFDAPSTCDVEGAICDVSWFFKCAKEGEVVPCGNPDISFWKKFFGNEAVPYGATWDLDAIKMHLEDPDSRRAVLYNHTDSVNPPCVISYQFQCVKYKVLDCTVNLRSSDVVNVLAQDLFMTGIILEEVSKMVGFEPGNITANLGNAHVYYPDLQFTEEFDIDYGD